MSDTKFEIDKEKLEVRISRLFKATPERMWQAFSDPEQIVKWWVDTKVDKHEFKTGGAWRYVSQGQDGKEYAFRGEFLEIDEPNKIVRTFEYEPVPGHVMTESVVFTLQDDGKTLMLQTAKYKNLKDLEGMTAMGMEDGASAGLDRLAQLVES